MTESIQVGKVVFLKSSSLGDLIIDIHDTILIGPGQSHGNVLLAYETYQPGDSNILAVEEWPGEVIWGQGDIFYPYEVLATTLLKSLENSILSKSEYDLAVVTAASAYAGKWSYAMGRSNVNRLQRLLYG